MNSHVASIVNTSVDDARVSARHADVGTLRQVVAHLKRVGDSKTKLAVIERELRRRLKPDRNTPRLRRDLDTLSGAQLVEKTSKSTAASASSAPSAVQP